MLNHSRITIRDGFIEARSYPLPYRRDKKVRCSDIEKVDTEVVFMKGMRNTEWPSTIIRAHPYSGSPIRLLKLTGEWYFLEQVADEIHRYVVHLRYQSSEKRGTDQ